VADHVEPARLKALDEMGEGQRALSVAMRWLGPKMRADQDPGSAGQSNDADWAQRHRHSRR
jgi:hypothetical protein